MTNKGKAIPTRFNPEEESFIIDLKKQTDLSKSEIIRRAVRFAGPKFLSGEVNLMTLIGAAQ